MSQPLRLRASIALFLLLIVGLPGLAPAQTPHQLVSIMTNQTNLGFPNQYGIPLASVSNDNGDFAFIGLRGSGLYYRKAGTPAAIRAVQAGDPIPGLPSARLAQIFTPLVINSNGVIAVAADIYTTGRVSSAVLSFDGTTLRTLVTGLDAAPGTGTTYGHGIAVVDINATGDVVINATLVPTGSTAAASPTVFFLPAGGGSTRIAGPGTPSPSGGGTFTAATGTGLSDSGQVLLNASITGGVSTSGLYVWQSGTFRKVAATGDPNPAGGTFSEFFTGTSQRMTANGLVAFIANNSLFTNTAADGNVLAVAAGSATPAPMGGTYGLMSTVNALSTGGDAVFSALVTGGASGSGIFRYRAGSGVELVARVDDAAPGTGQNYAGFLGVSVNASGTVSFFSSLSAGGNAIFQKPSGGAVGLISQEGDAAPTGGTFLFAGFPTITLSSGAVVTQVHVLNGLSAHHGAFRFQGGATTLMSTGDDMPPGANEIVRPIYLTAAGNFVGFDGQKAGGREVVGYYDVNNDTAAAVAQDAAPVSLAGNARLQFQAVNTVMVNASGDIAVQVSLFGGPVSAIRNAILVGGKTTAMTPATYDGAQDTGGRVLTSASLVNQGVRPIAINSGGTVAFTATANGVRGVWAGSAASAAVKAAIVGDVVSTGDTLSTILQFHGGINNAGQVLFVGNTGAGRGVFVVTPGATPVKVVQVGDAAPGGGTFLAFGNAPMPAFNNSGQVAFIATTAGGPGGGVYLATPSGGGYSVEAIALNGSASPAGGTFVLNTARPDVVLNDAGHVAFLSDLTGGGADSGIFAKRPAVALQAVATQGQSAPGTGSVFTTFTHGPNNFIEETLSISATGQIAFRGFSAPGGTLTTGWWHAETDNSLQPIVIVPSNAATFDGGTVSSTMILASWLSGDRFPVWAPLANGLHDGGLYAYVPTGGANTTGGSNVVVHPTDGLTGGSATVTFTTVSSPGSTTLRRASSGPVLPRDWYRVASFGAYYTITTTATFSGPISVCVDDADQHPPAGAVMQLLHWESNAWQNVTTSAIGSTICGTTSSLDLFVLAHALNVPTSNAVQNGSFSSGMNNWLVFATDGTVQDNSYIQFAVNNGVFEYYRVPPPSGSNQAVVLQNTGVAFGAGDPIVAHFMVGNTSSVRKRISVLIHASDFSDLSVCTFWIPPNTPMRAYAMRTHTTIAWPAGGSISFYAASAGSNGGVYQLDDVVMGPGHALTIARTDCIDPGEPGIVGPTDNGTVVTNGDFGTNNFSNWTTFGTITAQVSGGVAQFIRPSNTQPSGVLLQPTNAVINGGQVVTASFRLGNSSGVRKRITILMHDFSFGDLAACTFWLPAGMPLTTYSMRTYTTQSWSNATISFYPATTDTQQWFEVDDVSMKVTPSVPTYGSDCVEPGDTSGLSSAAAPPTGGSPEPAAVVTAEKQPLFTRLHTANSESKLQISGLESKSSSWMKSSILADLVGRSRSCRTAGCGFARGLLAPF